MATKIPATLLLVEDDEDVRAALEIFLGMHFQKVLTSSTPKKLNEILSRQAINLVLLDMNFQKGINDGREGLYWLNHIKEIMPQTAVVLITAYGTIDLAVESLKRGASDFVVKPWENQKLLSTVIRALELNKSQRKVKQLEEVISGKNKDGLNEHLLESAAPSMNNLFGIARKVAKTDANILITGENGTGKEVMARFIHKNSNRSHQPLITVDLGALNENLFESEIFGYQKGAFTDAKENKTGHFELANGGTLFLDEIGNIPPHLQSKLLTAIQSKTITPVGSNISIPVDCRIICASNLNLEEAVQSGEFRQDLFFRINTIELALPPLRKRREDIAALSHHFLRIFNHRYNKNVVASPEIIAALEEYHWPGNIRELQHVLERSLILAESSILKKDDLQLYKKQNVEKEEIEDFDLEQLEKWHILRILKKYDGNISRAAKILKINRNTLYRKIEKYGY